MFFFNQNEPIHRQARSSRCSQTGLDEILKNSTTKHKNAAIVNCGKRFCFLFLCHSNRLRERFVVGQVLLSITKRTIMIKQESEILDFWQDFSFFFVEKFRCFFDRKCFFFSELRKFLEYSFDVKSSNLSIYEVCSTF